MTKAQAWRWKSSRPPLPLLPPPAPQKQAMNKARALEMLKARLLVIAQEQQLKEVAQIRGDLVKAGQWRSVHS